MSLNAMICDCLHHDDELFFIFEKERKKEKVRAQFDEK
jgi:hypothetical protein